MLHRSNKKDIERMLVAMGMDTNYITRAFKVYEVSFIYDLTVISSLPCELIVYNINIRKIGVIATI